MSYQPDVVGSPFDRPTKTGNGFVFYPTKGQSIDSKHPQTDLSIYYDRLKDSFPPINGYLGVVKMTQEEYDALDPPNPNILYVIVEE